jgi:hypothetical protein
MLNLRRMGWTGHVACMDRKRNVYMVFGWNCKQTDPLKDSHRLEGMFRIDLDEIR